MGLIDKYNLSNDTKTIVYCILVIVVIIGLFFLAEYYKTQNLLKNGIRTNAIITNKYYEYDLDNKDTNSFSMRFKYYDIKTNHPEILNGYVSQKLFNKYSEYDTVKVVFEEEDKDHAKIIEDIE